ncbi:MAG: FkbM family methyltransferase [Desulfurococcales archaeon]|jgi:FkbM family methyltransferase|nr:FkbM family methyltransferase [Desulfurococcales archaeon]
MIEGYKKYLLEGLMYYLRSILFIRPVKKFFTRFIRRVLMHKYYEFKPWNVFLVLNRDVDAMLVHGSRHYIYAWRYEEKPSSLLRCLLRVLGRGVYVDVGAYVGFYTVLVAKHCWEVITFEPNPINLILLRYNIAFHGVGDRVMVVDKAAGDVLGYARFSISSSPSESSLTKYLRNKLRLLNIDVEVVTIDSILESLGIRDVENLVMKVDVEGFGLRVLRGARRSIEKYRPFILFEVHRTLDEEDEIHALKMLKDLGYGFIVVEPRSRSNFIVYAYPREKGCLCCEQA